MNKYDFIKQGNLLYWNTPDNEKSERECKIISTPEKVDSDSIILIATGSSEIEVLASELSPIGSSRSHKEEFMRWKKEREAEGNIPEVEYDWEMGKLTIDGEKWKSYLRNE